MGTLSDYMQREQIDPTEPEEFYIPCASDTEEERLRREFVRRKYHNRTARYGGELRMPDDYLDELDIPEEDMNHDQ